MVVAGTSGCTRDNRIPRCANLVGVETDYDGVLGLKDLGERKKKLVKKK